VASTCQELLLYGEMAGNQTRDLSIVIPTPYPFHHHT